MESGQGRPDRLTQSGPDLCDESGPLQLLEIAAVGLNCPRLGHRSASNSHWRMPICRMFAGDRLDCDGPAKCSKYVSSVDRQAGARHVRRLLTSEIATKLAI